MGKGKVHQGKGEGREVRMEYGRFAGMGEGRLEGAGGRKGGRGGRKER